MEMMQMLPTGPQVPAQVKGQAPAGGERDDPFRELLDQQLNETADRKMPEGVDLVLLAAVVPGGLPTGSSAAVLPAEVPTDRGGKGARLPDRCPFIAGGVPAPAGAALPQGPMVVGGPAVPFPVEPAAKGTIVPLAGAAPATPGAAQEVAAIGKGACLPDRCPSLAGGGPAPAEEALPQGPMVVADPAVPFPVGPVVTGTIVPLAGAASAAPGESLEILGFNGDEYSPQDGSGSSKTGLQESGLAAAHRAGQKVPLEAGNSPPGLLSLQGAHPWSRDTGGPERVRAPVQGNTAEAMTAPNPPEIPGEALAGARPPGIMESRLALFLGRERPPAPGAGTRQDGPPSPASLFQEESAAATGNQVPSEGEVAWKLEPPPAIGRKGAEPGIKLPEPKNAEGKKGFPQIADQTEASATPSGGAAPSKNSGEAESRSAVRLPSGQSVSETRIVDQVTSRIAIDKNHETSRISIKMHPEELGHVSLDLSVEHGRAKVHLVAQNLQVQEVLEKNLPRLRDALEQQGLKLDHLQVSVDSHPPGGKGFSQQDQPPANHPRPWTRAPSQPVPDLEGEAIPLAEVSAPGGISLRI